MQQYAAIPAIYWLPPTRPTQPGKQGSQHRIALRSSLSVISDSILTFVVA